MGAKAEIKNDADKGLFVLKLKDSAISESINYLKSKGLFPDKVDDSDDEYVFGDDDFPEAGEEEEAAGDMDDPFAMMGGMGEEEVYKVTLMSEAAEPTEAVPENCKADGDDYPSITYGALVPERLTSDKMEKKMKKI